MRIGDAANRQDLLCFGGWAAPARLRASGFDFAIMAIDDYPERKANWQTVAIWGDVNLRGTEDEAEGEFIDAVKAIIGEPNDLDNVWVVPPDLVPTPDKRWPDVA
jgi:hypothetical protein